MSGFGTFHGAGRKSGNVFNDNPGQTADAVPPPATSYATSKSAMRSPYRPMQGEQAKSRSAVVSHVPRRNGWENNYVYGDAHIPLGLPFVATGQARSTIFQPIMRMLADWMINGSWYEFGYPAATVMNGGAHNLGWSMRVDQLQTSVNGGPTPKRMGSKPAFTRVQNIPRYSSTPAMYPTRSSNT